MIVCNNVPTLIECGIFHFLYCPIKNCDLLVRWEINYSRTIVHVSMCAVDTAQTP